MGTLNVMETTRRGPATVHVASCYSIKDGGVADRRHIEIRYDNTCGGRLAYIVALIDDNVAESSRRRGSKAAALELASSLGYTEVV